MMLIYTKGIVLISLNLILCSFQGKFDYAKFFYEHVLALDPLNKLAEKNLEKLTMKWHGG